MAQKITYWLLISLLLSLGFGQLLRFGFGGASFYFHDILVVTVLVINTSSIKSLFKFPGLRLFFIGVVISSLFALTQYPLSNLLIPSLYLFRLLSYLAIYFVVKESKFSLPHQVFYVSGLVTIIIGLIQYFFLPDMRWASYLGWDDHLSRLVLPHFDPTFTAVMVGLFLLSMTRKIGGHYSITFFAASLAILLSYSRSIWISLAATAVIFIKNKFYLGTILLIMITGISLLPKKFGEGTNLFRAYSVSSRFNSDAEYVKKYSTGAITGRGLNTLILDSTLSQYENHASGPNNSYLYLVLTTGLLGLIGWSIFMNHLYKTSLHKEMLVFYFIAALFNNVMFYPFAILWVLLIEAKVPNAT